MLGRIVAQKKVVVTLSGGTRGQCQRTTGWSERSQGQTLSFEL